MQSWQLPEYIADILPSTARQLESAKEALLALFRVHGYELVSPPLLEYTASLLTKIDSGLSLKTIRVVDQLSGLQMGFRADITPQVARIDAHLLSANAGINRLCYAGTVIHAQPDSLLSTREPLQVGAELYGYAGVEADIELMDLMLKSLALADIPDIYLALGHIGVFRTLAEAAQLSEAQADALLLMMQDKDAEQVAAWLQTLAVPEDIRQALIVLPTLYGDVASVLARAQTGLPPLAGIQAALAEMAVVAAAFADQATVHVDLAELRVDAYHTGLLFAAYAPGWPDALARGGRYDGLGSHFGRARPATGFSLDLRDLIQALPPQPQRPGIKVAYADATAARAEIERLRQAGECVVLDYRQDEAADLGCDRALVWQNETWQVVAA